MFNDQISFASGSSFLESSPLSDAIADTLHAAYNKPKGTTRNRKTSTKPRQQRWKHVFCDVQKLSHPVGIEYTFIGNFTADEGVRMEKYTSALAPVFKCRLDKTKAKVDSVTTDPSVIEIPSAKMKTRKQIRETTQHIWAVAKSLNLVGHTDWHGGGGAHVHVGITKPNELESNRQVKALLLDATNRPYINWTFPNPGDTGGTRTQAGLLLEEDKLKKAQDSLAYWQQGLNRERIDMARSIEYCRTRARERGYAGQQLREYIEDECGYVRQDIRRAIKKVYKFRAQVKELLAEKAPAIDRDKCAHMLYNHSGKLYGMIPRSGYGTIEFRIFQAPNDPKEHELHVNFALAYVEWLEAKYKDTLPMPAIMTREQQQDAWPLDRCKKEFLKFVRTIGLKPNKYKRYLKNLEQRFALGKEYLL